MKRFIRFLIIIIMSPSLIIGGLFFTIRTILQFLILMPWDFSTIWLENIIFLANKLLNKTNEPTED